MLENKCYSVEHALSMYAYSYFHLPAEAIYDHEIIKKYILNTDNFHIYLIGMLPAVNIIDISQNKKRLILEISVLNRNYKIDFEIPDGFNLKKENELCFLSDRNGNRIFPENDQIFLALRHETGDLKFNIKYIGQSFGKDGQRNALDRLQNHETLQKIAIQGIPEGYRLELLLLEIHPENKIITSFNPKSSDANSSNERISSGIRKLFGTNEQERISLYEASLIRYFQPKYNKEFKESFPSTNMKVLRDCYDKDFSAVVSEICFDNMPYLLCSDKINPKSYHIIVHNLHKSEDRDFFFSKDNF